MVISWGILGAGKIADLQMATAINQARNHRLVAVMRRDGEQARAFASRHGAPRAYDSIEALLTDEEVNAVYVATPPNVHVENTIQVAEHGKHVLCEKPMALNIAEAQQMIDACHSNGVRLMICYYQRFNTRHQRIKRLLDAGAIGQVTAVRINFSDYFPPQPGFWHHDPSVSGGGPLMDLAPHCLDLLYFLCGPIVEVSAMVDTLTSESPVEDTATLLLRLDSGAHAVVTTHWSTANLDPNHLNSIELHGTKGTILAAPIHAKDSAGTLRLITAEGDEGFSVASGGQRSHVAMLEAYGEALNSSLPTPVSGEEGLVSLSAIHAAYESARTGSTIRVR